MYCWELEAHFREYLLYPICCHMLASLNAAAVGKFGCTVSAFIGYLPVVHLATRAACLNLQYFNVLAFRCSLSFGCHSLSAALSLSFSALTLLCLFLKLFPLRRVISIFLILFNEKLQAAFCHFLLRFFFSCVCLKIKSVQRRL